MKHCTLWFETACSGPVRGGTRRAAPVHACGQDHSITLICHGGGGGGVGGGTCPEWVWCPRCASEHFLLPSLSFLTCQTGLLTPPQLG